jgi:hypothetical protein
MPGATLPDGGTSAVGSDVDASTWGVPRRLDMHRGLLRSAYGRNVLVLGAGFSRAVNLAMPMNDELGNRAVARAQIADAPMFTDGRFESWLSRLAEPQPDLSPRRNAENRATFLAIAEAVHAEITESEQQTVVAELPPWLYRFAAAAHFDCTTLISFNYDTLIERAIAGLGLEYISGRMGGLEFGVEWQHAYRGIPPYAGGSVPLGEWFDTLRLLKLHGSTHWWWVPDDVTGTSLQHGHFDEIPSTQRRTHPGREPFIVPPAALKSSYFRNPIVSQLWRDAAAALQLARGVAFVGYSLPVTDLVAAGMFNDAIRDGVTVLVANPDESVAPSIQRLIHRPTTPLHDAEAFVDWFVGRRSEWVANELHQARGQLAANALVRVGWNAGAMEVATGAEVNNGVVEVRVAPFWNLSRPVTERDSHRAMHATQLADLCEPGMRVEAVFENGTRSPLVGIEHYRSDTGQTTAWQVLVPADRREDVVPSP